MELATLEQSRLLQAFGCPCDGFCLDIKPDHVAVRPDQAGQKFRVSTIATGSIDHRVARQDQMAGILM